MATLPKRMRLLVNEKAIRSAVIAAYMAEAGYKHAVIFSCGNAATALRVAGVSVTEIGPEGELEARRWWSLAQIRFTWPQWFDATSGHLPAPLMAEIAKRLAAAIGALDRDTVYEVETGSGETIACLRMAYPHITFEPVYNVSRGSQYDAAAPLNWIAAGGTAQGDYDGK